METTLVIKALGQEEAFLLLRPHSAVETLVEDWAEGQENQAGGPLWTIHRDPDNRTLTLECTSSRDWCADLLDLLQDDFAPRYRVCFCEYGGNSADAPGPFYRHTLEEARQIVRDHLDTLDYPAYADSLPWEPWEAVEAWAESGEELAPFWLIEEQVEEWQLVE